MKKVLCVLMVLLMVMLTACGNGSAQNIAPKGEVKQKAAAEAYDKGELTITDPEEITFRLDVEYDDAGNPYTTFVYTGGPETYDIQYKGGIKVSDESFPVSVGVTFADGAQPKPAGFSLELNSFTLQRDKVYEGPIAIQAMGEDGKYADKPLSPGDVVLVKFSFIPSGSSVADYILEKQFIVE